MKIFKRSKSIDEGAKIMLKSLLLSLRLVVAIPLFFISSVSADITLLIPDIAVVQIICASVPSGTGGVQFVLLHVFIGSNGHVGLSHSSPQEERCYQHETDPHLDLSSFNETTPILTTGRFAKPTQLV